LSAKAKGSATAITPLFRLVFFSVLGLTVLSILMNFGLVMWIDNPTDSAKTLMESCSTGWKLGFGAIVGLVGGKAV
jgi:hypothetical protein